MLRLFRQLILRQMWADRLRSANTVVGIAAGIAVVLAVRLANGSAVKGFEAALDLTAGRAGLEIQGAGFGIDEQTLAQLAWLRTYGVASPVIDGDVLVSAARAGAADEGRLEVYRVLGIDILRDRAVRDYTLGAPGTGDGPPRTSTDILRLLTDPTAVVITRAAADRLELSPGDALPVVVGDRTQTLAVRGVLEADGPARVSDGRFLMMDIAAAQWMFDRLGRIDRIDIALADGVDLAEAERAIAARLPAGLIVQRPARRGAQVERMLAAFHLNLTALSSIALLVGLFLVYNAVSVSVLARRQEIGTLRALGVTRRHVLALFLGEAVVFGALGVACGVPLGRLLAYLTVSLTAATVNTLYVASAAAPVALTAADLGVALAIGVPLALVAAWLPAREAARVPPTAALRGADRALARSHGQTRSRVGAVALLALSAASTRLPPLDGLPVAGYLASVALVFGGALLIPTVLQATARVGRTQWHRAFGAGGWLAHAAVGGAIGRVAVSVAALSVSLAMMVAITVMVGSFRQTVIDWVGQSLQADLFVGPLARRSGARGAAVSEEVEAVVRAHPDVAAVDAFHSVTVPYGDSLISLGAGDLAVQARYGTLRFRSVAAGIPAAGDARRQAAAVLDHVRAAGDAVIVSEPFANRYATDAGDRVTLSTPRGPVAFAVAGVYYDYSSDRGVVTMDDATFARHFGDRRPTGLTVYLKDGRSVEAARESLLGRLGGARVTVFTNSTLRAEVLRIFDSTFAITYALQAIAIVVALLGVVGTLMTLVIERERELAIVRAIGASRGQVRAMVVAEAAMLGIISQGAGILLGLLLALILVYVVNLQSFGWTIHLSIPWLSLLQMSALVVVTTMVAGLYPAQRSLRARQAPLEDE